MSQPRWIPSAPEISREALAVIAGALLAAAFFASFPKVRDWVRERLPTSN